MLHFLVLICREPTAFWPRRHNGERAPLLHLDGQNLENTMPSSNLFCFMHLRTLCTQWRFATPFSSIISPLFPIQRTGSAPLFSLYLSTLFLYLVSILPYVLPSSVCRKPFVFTLFTKMPGVGGILPTLVYPDLRGELATRHPRVSCLC